MDREINAIPEFTSGIDERVSVLADSGMRGLNRIGVSFFLHLKRQLKDETNGREVKPAKLLLEKQLEENGFQKHVLSILLLVYYLLFFYLSSIVSVLLSYFFICSVIIFFYLCSITFYLSIILYLYFYVLSYMFVLSFMFMFYLYV